MKKYILIAVTALCASCGSDYLNVTPTQSTSPELLYSTTENAKVAVNGLAKLMIRQYNSQGFNGEGTIKMYYGNYAGNYFGRNLPGWATVMNFEFVSSNNSTYTTYPWFYYYNLIGNANPLIAQIDNAKGPDAERKFIKAQGLAYRAYSYTQLCQFYGNRWKDSDNGKTLALVIRTEPNDENLPLSPLGKVYDQIYQDLDEAIQLFKESKMDRKPTHFYEPNLDVAYAIYARAALNREDYATAEKYAKLARENAPLMTNNQYKSGFNAPNQEWIWGSYNASDETLYFWSFNAYIGYNSTANMVRSYPASMSRVLFNKIPDTDMRKELFLNPGDDYIPENPGLLSENAEKEPEQAALAKKYRELYPDLQSNAKLNAYMQFKFKNIDQPGVANLNHFRAAEMVLIEAEANYKLGNEAQAQNLLNELNQERDATYQCTATGADLFEEIKFYRAVELWGEGFDWFDLKRWGDTRVRNTFKTKLKPGETPLPDELYDQFPSTLALTIKPEANNKWTFVIPQKESDYNPEIK